MNVYNGIIVAGFVFIFILGVIGNLFVMYVFHPRKNKDQLEMEMLIFYLAFIDLISSILNPTLFIYWQITDYNEWIFGRLACKLIPGFQKISVTISLGMILLITLERTVILAKNIRIDKKKLKILVMVIVLLSILTELRFLINLDLYPSQVKLNFDCFDSKSYQNRTDLQEDIFNFKTSYTCAEVETKNFDIKAVLDEPNVFEYISKNINKNQLVERVSEFIECERQCEVMTIGCTTRVTSGKHLEIIVLLLRDIISVSIVITCNVVIYKVMYNKERTSSLQGQEAALKPTPILRLLLVMAVVFILLVFPKDIFRIVYFFSWLHGFGIDYQIALNINVFLALLQTSNCVCNVFIYARMHKRFKRKIPDSKAISQSLRRLSKPNIKKAKCSRLTDSVEIIKDSEVVKKVFVAETSFFV